MNYSMENKGDIVEIEGEKVSLHDLIDIYKKSKKLKKSLNKSSLSYYYRNSDDILRRMKKTYGEKRYNCTCGASVINKVQHLRSKKHVKFINS
jgi:uncharacterized membrane protein